MKKIIFTIAFFTACIAAHAQINKDTVGMNLPVKDGQVIYTAVVLVDGKTKNDLYQNAQQWFMDYFSSQKNVIQADDREDGLVFGRGILYFSTTYTLSYINWASHITFKIECKDNKYRYSFYNMVINNYDSGNSNYDIEQLLGTILGTQNWPYTKSEAQKVLIKNDTTIKSAISSLEKAMKKTTSDF